LTSLGRRLVEASAELPRGAFRLLERPATRRRRRPPSGAAPGEMVVPADAPEPTIRAVRYSGATFEQHTIDDPESLRALIDDPASITWIDVEGFGSRSILARIGEVLDIHPLALADVVHVPQRPKAELYGDRLLVISQMARVIEEGRVDIEQVSLVLGPRFVVSFQERPGDVFDPVRTRLGTAGTRIRTMGPDYLLYSLVDAVIDGYFPVIEALGDAVDALEEEVILRPTPATLARIHATRQTLLAMHRVQWRQRDALSLLLRDEALPITPEVKPYLRDAHDHAYQTLDAIETYRDLVVGLMDLHLSSASHRLNEVMRTLTIVATVFIPLTFVAGVYGMNFDVMPELHWRWGYPAFWIAMIVLAVVLLAWFRRRGWLGDGAESGD
jgi:magnesium transporter